MDVDERDRVAAQRRARVLEDGQPAEERQPRAEHGGAERPGLRPQHRLAASLLPAEQAEDEDHRHGEDRQVDDETVDLRQGEHAPESVVRR
jgi:hypothetical protein